MSTIGDKEILNVLLNEHKLSAGALTHLVLESANQSLRNDASAILQNTFKHQKQIFDILSQKGWYPTDAASAQEIDKARQELTAQGNYPY